MRGKNFTDDESRRRMRLDDHDANACERALPLRWRQSGDRVIGELQPNVERAPLPRLTFHIDAATHRFDQPADDRESEPRAAVAAIECAVRLCERIEDRGAFVRVDADSRIAHLQMQNDIGAEALLRPAADDHLTCGREFDRVADEVDENLPQTQWIAPQTIGRFRRDGECHMQPFLCRGDAEGLHRVGNELADGEVHRLELELPRLDAGEVENVFDRRQQRFRRTAGHLQLLPPLHRGLAVTGKLQHAQDAVQRRAHFVRDVREEFALGGACRFCAAQTLV